MAYCILEDRRSASPGGLSAGAVPKPSTGHSFYLPEDQLLLGYEEHGKTRES